MVYLGNSSIRLEYRAQEEVARHDTGEVDRPFWQAQEFGLYHTGNEKLIRGLNSSIWLELYFGKLIPGSIVAEAERKI